MELQWEEVLNPSFADQMVGLGAEGLAAALVEKKAAHLGPVKALELNSGKAKGS